MFKNNKGMSLVQVMIALGLMSVIGLGVAELMVTSTKVNKRSEVKLSQLVLVNELQTVTSNPTACSDAIDGGINNNFDPNVAVNAGWDLKLEIAGETIEANHVITNGLTIDRLYYKLDNPNPIDNNGVERTFLGKVLISFNVDDNIMGGSLQEKSIGSMYIRVRNAAPLDIVACEREVEVPISEVCTSNLKGTFDPVTQECTLPPNTPPPSGNECTAGSIQSFDHCSGAYSGNTTRKCIDGYWVVTNQSACTLMTCFTGDTLVKMFDKSSLPISEVNIGDYVLGEDGAINYVYEIETVPLGERKLYSFNGKTPHFITEEHPVKTLDGWKSFNPIATLTEHSILNRNHLFNVNPQPLSIKDTLIKYNQETEKLEYYTSIHGYYNMTVYNLRLRAAPISPYNDNDDRSNTYFANGYLVHNK